MNKAYIGLVGVAILLIVVCSWSVSTRPGKQEIPMIVGTAKVNSTSSYAQPKNTALTERPSSPKENDPIADGVVILSYSGANSGLLSDSLVARYGITNQDEINGLLVGMYASQGEKDLVGLQTLPSQDKEVKLVLPSRQSQHQGDLSAFSDKLAQMLPGDSMSKLRDQIAHEVSLRTGQFGEYHRFVTITPRERGYKMNIIQLGSSYSLESIMKRKLYDDEAYYQAHSEYYFETVPLWMDKLMTKNPE
jgi:hypothetical protein